MQDDTKTHMQVMLGTVMMHERTVNESIDDTIRDAIGELARQQRTAFWVEAAAAGAVRRYGSEQDAATSRDLARRVYEIVLWPETMGVSFDSDGPAAELDRFWIVVSNIEAEYDAAIRAFETGIIECGKQDALAAEKLQALYDDVLLCARRAAVALPPLDFGVRDEVAVLLKESAWLLSDGRITSRVSEAAIGAWTSVYESERKPIIGFKYRLRNTDPWSDASALVRRQADEWSLDRTRPTWLHQRKRQLQINNAEIDALYGILEGLNISGPQAWPSL